MNERIDNAVWGNVASPSQPWQSNNPNAHADWYRAHNQHPRPDSPYAQAGYYTEPLQAPVYAPHYPHVPAPGYGYPSDHAPRHHPYSQPTAYSEPSGKAPPQTQAVLHSLAAVLSVVLLFGGAAWVWQLMQRDVAGVPVVRALEGPLRETPQDAGGRQTAHQGLSVNNLTGLEQAADPDTRDLVLAPPPGDLPMEDVILPPQQPPQQSLESLSEGTEPVLASLQQNVEQPARPTESLGIISPTRRAVTSSPRPPKRNAATATTQVAALASPPASSSIADDLASSVASSVAHGLSGIRDIDIDPATIGPGTRLVQLGAYDDVEAARAAWDQLARRFAPLLDDRGRVIEAAHSGGSVFYRLRAHGFQDERDARRFCAGLVDQQIDCIPVLIR